MEMNPQLLGAGVSPNTPPQGANWANGGGRSTIGMYHNENNKQLCSLNKNIEEMLTQLGDCTFIRSCFTAGFGIEITPTGEINWTGNYLDVNVQSATLNGGVINITETDGESFNIDLISADAGNLIVAGTDGGLFADCAAFLSCININGGDNVSVTEAPDGTFTIDSVGTSVVSTDGTANVTLNNTDPNNLVYDISVDGNETVVQGIGGITVTGTGTVADPYTVSGGTDIVSTGGTISITSTTGVTGITTYDIDIDCDDVANCISVVGAGDVIVTGSGTVGDPYVISYTTPVHNPSTVTPTVVGGNTIAIHDNGFGAVVNVQETITSFSSSILTAGNVLQLTYEGEGGQQVISVDLSSLSTDINVDNFSYDPLTQDLIITETDGQTHNVSLTSLIDTNTSNTVSSTDASIEVIQTNNPDGTINYDLMLDCEDIVNCIAVQGGADIQVNGIGSNANPYVITYTGNETPNSQVVSTDGTIDVTATIDGTTGQATYDIGLDCADVAGCISVVAGTDVTVTGNGTVGNPYVINSVFTPAATTNVLDLTGNVLTSTVNGVADTVNLTAANISATQPAGSFITFADVQEFIDNILTTDFLTVNAGTTNVVTDDANGTAGITMGETLHFFSTSADINVTEGSAIVEFDIVPSTDAGNGLSIGTDGKLFVGAGTVPTLVIQDAADVCESDVVFNGTTVGQVAKTNNIAGTASVTGNTLASFQDLELRGENDTGALDTETAGVAQKVMRSTVKTGCVMTDTTSVERYINLTTYVDAQFGNDATGIAGREDRPFATIAAAVGVIGNADSIVVRHGAYAFDVDSPLIDLNIHLESGAVLNNTADITLDGNNNSITGDGVLNIAGSILFNQSGTSTISLRSINKSGGDFGLRSEGGQTLYIDAKQGTTTASPIAQAGDTGVIYVSGNTFINDGTEAMGGDPAASIFSSLDGGEVVVDVSFSKAIGAAGGNFYLESTGGDTEIRVLGGHHESDDASVSIDSTQTAKIMLHAGTTLNSVNENFVASSTNPDTNLIYLYNTAMGNKNIPAEFTVITGTWDNTYTEMVPGP